MFLGALTSRGARTCCTGDVWLLLAARTYKAHSPKALCSFTVHTWALKELPYHNFRVHVYTMKLHGAFGIVCEFLGVQYLWFDWVMLLTRGAPRAGKCRKKLSHLALVPIQLDFRYFTTANRP